MDSQSASRTALELKESRPRLRQLSLCLAMVVVAVAAVLRWVDRRVVLHTAHRIGSSS